MSKRGLPKEIPRKGVTSSIGREDSRPDNTSVMSEAGEPSQSGQRRKKTVVTEKDLLDLAYYRLLQAQSMEYLFKKSQLEKRRDMEAQSATLARVLLNATEELLELERAEREVSALQKESQMLTVLDDVLSPAVDAAEEMKEATDILGRALQVCQNQLLTKGLADFSGDMGDIKAAFAELNQTLTDLGKLNLNYEAPYQEAAQALNTIVESADNIRSTIPTLEEQVATLNKLELLNSYASASSSSDNNNP